MMVLGHFFLGFIVSFLGTIPPGGINLLVIKIASTKGLRKAMAFVAGATMIEVIYSFIAIIFSRYLLENKSIGQAIELTAVPVFLVLGYFSITKKTAAKEIEEADKGSELLNGLFMGLVNLMQIPFWIGYASYFISIGWLKEEMHFIWIFISGIVAGSISLLFIFAYYSKKWLQGNNSSVFNSDRIHVIIGWIFIILAMIQAGKIAYSML